jgi:hypothetical protein
MLLKYYYIIYFLSFSTKVIMWKVLTVCCRLLLDTPALAAGAAGMVPVDIGPVNSVADSGSTGDRGSLSGKDCADFESPMGIFVFFSDATVNVLRYCYPLKIDIIKWAWRAERDHRYRI